MTVQSAQRYDDDPTEVLTAIGITVLALRKALAENIIGKSRTLTAAV